MSWPSNYPGSPDDDRKFTESKSNAQPTSGILKDFKVGFTLAVKNIISFGLAMLGIIFITIILLLVILPFFKVNSSSLQLESIAVTKMKAINITHFYNSIFITCINSLPIENITTSLERLKKPPKNILTQPILGIIRGG